jgi:hypothetical protein
LPDPFKKVNVWRLTGPSIDATGNVSLANAVIGDDLSWVPGSEEKCNVKNNQCHLAIPGSSAALLFLKK